MSTGPGRDAGPLIPRPEEVRLALCRAVREAKRLRALLRLSMQAEEDARYVSELAAQQEQRRAVG